MVLKELILISFHFGWVWWSLNELIFYSFYFQQGVVILKELILTVSILGGCGHLERTDFLTVSDFRRLRQS